MHECVLFYIVSVFFNYGRRCNTFHSFFHIISVTQPKLVSLLMNICSQ